MIVSKLSLFSQKLYWSCRLHTSTVGEHFLETFPVFLETHCEFFWMSDELIFLLIKMIVKEKPINPNVFGCNFCLLQQLYMWCFARFGTICTILKTWKHQWRSVTFSKVAGFYFSIINCKIWNHKFKRKKSFRNFSY